ncbi:MAG: terminase family protein [Pseudomonadota bacterium]
MELLRERKKQRDQRKLFQLYPDTGPLRRELYAKHLQFFAAGLTHRERAMLAANRVGKTWGVGGYETALHLTGLYPDWWPGLRFEGPIDSWAAGDTSETTRDIVQLALMGPPDAIGTGLIPADSIDGYPTRRSNIRDAFDTVRIKHVSGGTSRLGFKSYDQGRKKFQGTAKHWIWLDEEPPAEVYTECVTRTMTTQGQVACTFTPLEGMSDVTLMYLGDAEKDISTSAVSGGSESTPVEMNF